MEALYFNLDLTLTRMTRGFDDLVVDTLAHVGAPESAIDADAYSHLFFERFDALEPEPRRAAFAAYFEEFEVDADPDRARAQHERLEFDAIRPVTDDLRPTLQKLGETYRLGVLTSGTTRLQRAKLRKLRVRDLLDDVAISYELGATKEGELFARAEERLPADGRIYVSNSPSDVEAARAAGWETVDAEFADLEDDPLGAVERLRR